MTTARSFRFWQALTIALLVTGYAGYYFCRSDLSVAMPMLIKELAVRGIPAGAAKIQLGSIASLGVFAYALGKFGAGRLADLLGGRNNFFLGMGGAILFTLLFTLGGGFPIFTIAWMGNRAVQSLGWAGMVKIVSRWFSYSTYGTVMGIVSLSYLFGDAAARELMAQLISAGMGWRGLFYVAAGSLGALLLANILLLKETPGDLGFPEPPANPENLFVQDQPGIFQTLLKSPVFWVVCFISLGVTLLRETFNLWIPTYFSQAVGLTDADAAHKSALFPLFGGFSVILAGFLSDRLGKKGRPLIMIAGLLLTCGALLALAYMDFGGSQITPVVLVTLVAFLLLGPYSYLAGAISLDFGGKKGSATASGLIDGVGYLGGVLAGNSVAGISVAWGWTGAFAALAVVAAISCIAATTYYFKIAR